MSSARNASTGGSGGKEALVEDPGGVRPGRGNAGRSGQRIASPTGGTLQFMDGAVEHPAARCIRAEVRSFPASAGDARPLECISGSCVYVV